MLRLFVYIYENALWRNLETRWIQNPVLSVWVRFHPRYFYTYKGLFDLSFNFHLIEFNFCKLTTVPHFNPLVKFFNRFLLIFINGTISSKLLRGLIMLSVAKAQTLDI